MSQNVDDVCWMSTLMYTFTQQYDTEEHSMGIKAVRSSSNLSLVGVHKLHFIYTSILYIPFSNLLKKLSTRALVKSLH